jgi:hypothetical protein
MACTILAPIAKICALALFAPTTVISDWLTQLLVSLDNSAELLVVLVQRTGGCCG